MLRSVWRGAWVLAAVASIAGCASFPKNFDPASGQSLLVTADLMPVGSNLYYFRKIDPASGRFVGGPVGTMLYAGSYWRLTKGDNRKDITFSVMSDVDAGKARTIPPGQYAYVGIENMTGSVGYSTPTFSVAGTDKQTFLCLGEKAPVFTVAPGEIIVVPAGALPVSNSELATEFSKARAAYPEIHGEARVADMEASSISFGGASTGKALCLAAAQFLQVK